MCMCVSLSIHYIHPEFPLCHSCGLRLSQWSLGRTSYKVILVMVFLNMFDNYLSIWYSQSSFHCCDFTKILNQGFSCLFSNCPEGEHLIIWLHIRKTCQTHLYLSLNVKFSIIIITQVNLLQIDKQIISKGKRKFW